MLGFVKFFFFCFVLYCCAFVQYCNVKTILHTISCINLLVYWTTSRCQLLCHYIFTFGHLLLEAQTFQHSNGNYNQWTNYVYKVNFT